MSKQSWSSRIIAKMSNNRSPPTFAVPAGGVTPLGYVPVDLRAPQDLPHDYQELMATVRRRHDVLRIYYPIGHPQHALACTSLASSLYSLYNQTRELKILNQALMLQREVLSLSPLHHPDRVRACVDLSRSIHAQYQQTSNTLLLDEAIAIQREALSICSPDHPDCARACLDLSCSLGTRFKQTGDTLLLNEAITLQRQAFTLCPPGHPNHASLFQPFYTQFYETGDTITALRDEMPTQELVDQISEIMHCLPPTGARYAQVVQMLRHLCRAGGFVPTSSQLSRVVWSSDEPVSRSHFSDIYHGSFDTQDVAVKVLRLHVDELQAVKRAYLHELVIWTCLRHENIVPFIGTSVASDVSLVSEWMSGGTISTYLLQRAQASRIGYVGDVIRGLTYMHSLDVVHGDMKASNVLVDSEGRARLTDFGLATALHATRTSTTTGGAGSLRWMAPELLDPEKYDIPEPDANRPTKESDVYALAITIWEIFNSEFPFSKMRDAKVIASVLSGLRPPRNEDVTGPRGLSDEVWASMVGWWDELPPARPMLAQSGSMEE